MPSVTGTIPARLLGQKNQRSDTKLVTPRKLGKSNPGIVKSRQN